MTVFRDKFGNPLNVGDYVVMPGYVFGMHYFYITDAVKVIGFREAEYGGRKRQYIIFARRYPSWERGLPYQEEEACRVVKTTLHNYLVSQKNMFLRDKEERENPVKESKDSGYFTKVVDAYKDVPDWVRPYKQKEYWKDGHWVMNHPQTRKRKARKMRRQVTDVSKYIKTEKTEVEENERHPFGLHSAT